MARAGENSDDGNDATLVAARSQRLRTIVESYLMLLSRTEGDSGKVGEETFGLADALRG